MQVWQHFHQTTGDSGFQYSQVCQAVPHRSAWCEGSPADAPAVRFARYMTKCAPVACVGEIRCAVKVFILHALRLPHSRLLLPMRGECVQRLTRLWSERVELLGQKHS